MKTQFDQPHKRIRSAPSQKAGRVCLRFLAEVIVLRVVLQDILTSCTEISRLFCSQFFQILLANGRGIWYYKAVPIPAMLIIRKLGRAALGLCCGVVENLRFEKRKGSL